MEKFYFHIDRNSRKREVAFYFGEDREDGKGFLDRADKLILSFNTVIYQAQSLNDGLFETALNPVKAEILNAFGQKKAQSAALNRALKSAKKKHRDNIMLLVCVNVLENEYHNIVEKMYFRERYQFGIPVSSSVIKKSQEQFRFKYQELQNSLKKFADYFEKDL